MINNTNQDECDFDMNNHITMGQNRKLKRRLKKLQKKSDNNDHIFKEMDKYKQTLYKGMRRNYLIQ